MIWGGASHALTAKHSATGRYDPNGETWIGRVPQGGGIDVAHALRADGFDASEDGTGRGTPLIPVPFDTTQITSKGNYSAPQLGDPCHPLAAGAHPPAIAFDCKASGRNGFGTGEISPTLRAMGHSDSHQNTGGQVAVAIQERAVSENLENGPQGKGYQEGVAYTLEARNKVQSVATSWAVRRLTPRECERLQGFPDDYTLVPWRKGMAPDGPRYKALGNSMAVNVMRWIGTRIQMVEDLGLSIQQAAE